MSFLRPISIVRTSALRPLSQRAAAAAAPRAYVPVRLAHQDYGSGDGNPVGENPQQQGKNPRSELEHPGPPAPKVGQGKSSSSSSSSSKSGEEKGGHRTGGKGSNRDSPSSSNGSSGGSSSSGGSGSGSKGTKGAQPKILNENPPGEHDESVRQHNKEMEQRAEKAHEQVSNEDAKKDKVSPKFWSGQGGADKDP